jgi:hypothetical protein
MRGDSDNDDLGFSVRTPSKSTLTIFAALELSDINNMSRRLPFGWLSFFMKKLYQFGIDASLVRKEGFYC